MTQPIPPGWYPDPSGEPGTRYWDGKGWTAAQVAKPQRRKRLAWPWVLLGVVLLLFGGCGALVVLGVSVSDNNHGGSTAAMGQEVRDGKFAFVVQNVRTSMQEGTSAPRGEFVIVTMTVTNIGKEPQSFFVQNQKLIDSAGRQYAADASVASSINQDSMVIDMNPGFTITESVPFDVPVGTIYTAVEMHDSMFSVGAKAKL